MGVVPVKERFDKHHIPEPNSGCWIWTSAYNRNGYGRLSFKRNGKNNFKLAHRLSWELFKGEIPSGIFICHKCDTRSCVNPEHLFLGTAQDNTNDRKSKGRTTKHKRNFCVNGHEYKEENIYLRPNGTRECRTCWIARGSKTLNKQLQRGVPSES